MHPSRCKIWVIECVKNFKGTLSGLRQFLANGSKCKNDEKCFLFHLKSSFYSQDIQEVLVKQKNGLVKKVRFISKFMTSQLGWKTITIYILHNISRRKGNQAMKFGQLIDYNMRNIFPEKSYTKCGGETSLRLFSKKSKLSISLDHYSKVLQSLFLLNIKFKAIEIY